MGHPMRMMVVKIARAWLMRRASNETFRLELSKWILTTDKDTDLDDIATFIIDRDNKNKTGDG